MASSDMFVIVKTGKKGCRKRACFYTVYVALQLRRTRESTSATKKEKSSPAEGLVYPASEVDCYSLWGCEWAAYMLAEGSDRWVQTSLYHTHRRTGGLRPHTSHHSGTGRKHTR